MSLSEFAEFSESMQVAMLAREVERVPLRTTSELSNATAHLSPASSRAASNVIRAVPMMCSLREAPTLIGCRPESSESLLVEVEPAARFPS